MPFKKSDTKPLKHQFDNTIATTGVIRKTLRFNARTVYPWADFGGDLIMDVMFPSNVREADYESAVTIDGKPLSEWRNNPTDKETGLNEFDGTRTTSAKSNQ